MSEHPTKSFRLSIVNAAEDVPRLIRAYGRACGGEFALVLRPSEERGVLVLVMKGGARAWRSGSWDWRLRAQAEVRRVEDGSLRLVQTTGGHVGTAWQPQSSAGLRIGKTVSIAYAPDDQIAEVVPDTAPAGGDAPGTPSVELTPKDAVALVKTEQKTVPKPGPITLRGQWAGTVRCDGGAPVVELRRKLAAYGTLRITSSPTGWAWEVERVEKWFSKPGADRGAAPTLVKAIEQGLARAMGLLGEACSVRDSRRRAALDAGWAVEHPVKPAAEGRDPLDRMKPAVEKPARAPRKPRGSPWTWVADPPEADPIEAPSRDVQKLMERGSLVHDAGAGTFLGRSVVAHGELEVGSLVFRPAGADGAWLVRAPAEAKPTRAARTSSPNPAALVTARKGKSKPTNADELKDKALLDAFGAALASALEGSN